MNKFGISTALLTPFDEQHRILWDSLCEHALEVMANGADSVTLFGTTGEGASISRAERIQGIEALLNAGCDPARLVLGVCATAVGDALEQVEDGLRRGVHRFLLMPPFYFTPCEDSGLLRWHMALFSQCDSEARFILYHIPQLTNVRLSVAFIEQLLRQAPDRVIAIKDSSGDWSHAAELLASNSTQVLIGDERVLHRSIALGGGGAISGMANLYPARMKQIAETAREDKELTAEVSRIVTLPVIPAIKARMAQQSGEMLWRNVRAPLTPLNASEEAQVLAATQKHP